MKFPYYYPRIFHTEVYQGKRKPKNYFEGWYYKHVSQDGSEIWSIIFGVSHSDDPHSFIQIIEGKSGVTDYVRFDINAFSYEKKRLHIQIDKNSISENSIKMDLVGEKFSIKGQIEYSNLSPFPQYFFSPGIMGWYTFAPFMECYHGVVSMNHELKGSLNIGSKSVNFTGGKGYIEKDGGK
ncbi:MAG: hypothetical protein PF450_11065, partial [Bacteroidales bacterium]|nr:hypothetical protein [Bacteroidales bacterium]